MRGVWTLTTAPDRDRQPYKRSITVGPEVAQALTVVPPVLLQGVFVSPLPAVRGYIKDGTTGDASVAPYALMVANGAVWLTYGILIEAPTVALPNVTAVALGMYYTYTFHKYKTEDAPFAPYIIAASSVASLAIGTALVLEPEAAAHTVGLIGCGVLPAMFAGPLAAASGPANMAGRTPHPIRPTVCAAASGSSTKAVPIANEATLDAAIM